MAKADFYVVYNPFIPGKEAVIALHGDNIGTMYANQGGVMKVFAIRGFELASGWVTIVVCNSYYSSEVLRVIHNLSDFFRPID